MKKLFSVLSLTLALNFLAAAGGVGWLYQTGRLDKTRIAKIKEILFPPPGAEVATSQPAETQPSDQPHLKLDELLAQKAGLPVGQQVEFIQQTFDAKMAELDRRQRELLSLKDQVEKAQATLSADRTKLLKGEQKLTDQQQEAARLAADKGFQDTLALYATLPAKQVKKIFLTLDDDTIVRYLQAMEPRAAGKTLKEFKTPDELNRIQRVMEKMRTTDSTPTTSPASLTPPAKE